MTGDPGTASICLVDRGVLWVLSQWEQSTRSCWGCRGGGGHLCSICPETVMLKESSLIPARRHAQGAGAHKPPPEKLGQRQQESVLQENKAFIGIQRNVFEMCSKWAGPWAWRWFGGVGFPLMGSC